MLVIAVTSALLWHRFVVTYVLAAFGATISTVITFQIVAFIQIGYLDPFFLIAVATTTVIAAVISALIGLPFHIYREKRAGGTNEP